MSLTNTCRTIFLFREHVLPILCPITHILARALRDRAIKVAGYDSAEPFFNTKLGRGAVKVQWKPHMLKIPVFRKSVQVESGGWEKSPTEAMIYATYAFCLNRLGTGVNFEERLTSYCLRRGLAEALVHVAPDAIVDQVMRHDPMTGCLQNAYLNFRVGWNTQMAFLGEEPSDDGLTRAFTHMSIGCDAAIPKEIPSEELEKLGTDPTIEILLERTESMSATIKCDYGFLNRAPKTVLDEYRRLQSRLKNAKKKFRDEMTRVYRDACRSRLHDEELERQLSGATLDTTIGPMIHHQLEERNQVRMILCDFNRDLSSDKVKARKVCAIDLLIALASCREVRRPTQKLMASTVGGSGAQETSLASQEAEKDEAIPRKLEKTQCPVCIGDEQLSYGARTRRFTRVSHMMTHVDRVHLQRKSPESPWVCYHPSCKTKGRPLPLESLNHFKNHVKTEHGVKLRE